MKRFGIMLLLGLMTFSTLPPAYAAEKKDKSARRIALMKQQFEAEKAQMQTQFDQDKAALEAKVQAGEKEAGEIKGSLASVKRRNASLTTELDTLHKEKAEIEAHQQATEARLSETQALLEKTSKSLAVLTEQHQIAQRDLKSNDAQRKELSKLLVQRDQGLASCNEKNTKLYDFGLQLTKIYDKPSAYDAVLRAEPFAQTRRVELENILQDYRDKLDEQRIVTTAK